MKHTPLFALLTVALGVSACSMTASPQSVQDRLQAAASASGVTNLSITSRTDGGLNVSGKLNSLPFAVRVPSNWNNQSMLFAHGYATPSPNVTEQVPDPNLDTSYDYTGKTPGLLTLAYSQGYAAANTAYSKVGYAVESGIAANKALHDFLAKAGSNKQYIVGASMGGNIAVGLAEKYSGDYAGALPICGVVAGWREEMRYLLDVRVVYDYFTKGTPYALPGNGDALTVNPAYTQDAVNASVGGLFGAAGKGDAAAQAIIAQVSKVAGVTADPISYIVPLAVTIPALGDYLATTGGNGYSNTTTVYSGSANDAALNAGVQRLSATNAASTYLNANYTPTGKFSAKMLSIHNTSDPLVPYRHELLYAATVKAAGNSANLVQQVVDPKAVNLADLKSSGPAHCYFTMGQLSSGWNQLRTWVDQGVRPLDGANITNVQ